MIYTTPNTSLLTEVDAEGNPVCDFSQIVEISERFCIQYQN